MKTSRAATVLACDAFIVTFEDHSELLILGHSKRDARNTARATMELLGVEPKRVTQVRPVDVAGVINPIISEGVSIDELLGVA